MNIISRSDAATAGLKHFYTGKKCKRGHLRERSVSTGACLDCLAFYARRYHEKMVAAQRDNMLGIVEIKIAVRPEDAGAISAFGELFRLARIAGTPVPLVPRAEDVPAVNTMIQMMRPAAPAHAPTPKQAPQPVGDLSSDDARHAMWVRIHGKEIADQMAGRC
jgi:hypothetical protein